jgi:hypothetical protein
MLIIHHVLGDVAEQVAHEICEALHVVGFEVLGVHLFHELLVFLLDLGVEDVVWG